MYIEKELLNVLKLAGDEAARRGLKLVDLDPYAKEVEAGEIVHVAQWQKIKAAKLLINMISATSGEKIADDVRSKIQFVAEDYDWGTLLLNLDEAKWMLYSHLIAVRMIELQKA